MRSCKEVVRERIEELCEGIKEEVAGEFRLELIKKWANEIDNQCDVIRWDKDYESDSTRD